MNNEWLLLAIALWTLPWKGVALWRAAGRREKWWFLAILVLNTAAILEILYIFIFSHRKQENADTPAFSDEQK